MTNKYDRAIFLLKKTRQHAYMFTDYASKEAQNLL